MPRTTRTVAERFAALSDASAGPDRCHVWRGATFINGGTGAMKVEGKKRHAHRVAWELVHGPLPWGFGLARQCLLPVCVNVRHYRMVRRYRVKPGPTGPVTGKRKLSDDAKLELRALYLSGGVTQRWLAERYGVDSSTIYRLVRGLPKPEIRAATVRSRSLLPPELQDLAEARVLAGETQHAVALSLGVSDSLISHLMRARVPGWKGSRPRKFRVRVVVPTSSEQTQRIRVRAPQDLAPDGAERHAAHRVRTPIRAAGRREELHVT